MKVKSFSCVRLSATPWTAAYQAPPIHGIFQARVLEWGAIAFSMGYIVPGILQARILERVAFPFSRGSSQPMSSALQADSLPAEPQGKPLFFHNMTGRFPDGSVVKNPPANAEDSSSIPGLGRSPVEGNGNPL